MKRKIWILGFFPISGQHINEQCWLAFFLPFQIEGNCNISIIHYPKNVLRRAESLVKVFFIVEPMAKR